MKRALLGCVILLSAASAPSFEAVTLADYTGAELFQRFCASCHGANGRGLQRLGLIKPPRDLTRAEFHEQVTDEQLILQVPA